MNKSINITQSKHAKYYTKNPISNYLIKLFFKTLKEFIWDLEFNSILDVGCGEGMLLRSLSDYINDKSCCAIDIDENEVRDASKYLPFCSVKVGSVYEIPFNNNSFELVTCTEVFEHLVDPYKALLEIERVSSKYILLSVPNEPIWRILNILRLSYIKEFGNTPGHLNHWKPNEFKYFVEKKFEIVKMQNPLPWTIILATKYR